MNWWATKNPDGHLSFYYDIYYQAPTDYEPINLSSNDDDLWIVNTFSKMGISGTNWYYMTQSYLNQLRAAKGTDWAVVAFVVDSLNDSDGKFPNGYFGYTYSQSLPLIVMTYDNDGWGINRMDSVMAHEFAHDFGAGDEYCSPGYACCSGGGQYGYLGVPNAGCEAGCDHDGNGICDGKNSNPATTTCNNCPTCVETTCLMRQGGLDSGLDQPSKEQVGMRDSDDDGILDPLDTDLTISLDAFPPEMSNTSSRHYSGSVTDPPYASPSRNNVTINKIVRVEYVIDGDLTWRQATAQDGAFDSISETYIIDTPALADGAHDIYIHAVDSAGNTSNILHDNFTVDTVAPVTSISAIPRYSEPVFLDFWLNWAQKEPPSGVASYDVQYRDGLTGEWQNLYMGTEVLLQLFVGVEGHTYYFRARARDLAGNLGDYTDGSTVYTVNVCPVAADEYEDDNSLNTAREIGINSPQQIHAIHRQGDEDWSRFYAVTGQPYTLRTYNLGGHADTVLYLYDANGSLLWENDDEATGVISSRLDWTPANNGMYYIKVNHFDSYAFGCSTEYGLTISTEDTEPPTASMTINDNAAFTRDSTVSITLSAEDRGSGVWQMRISNRSDFQDAQWVEIDASPSWTLPQEDGSHTVYLQVMDWAGNISDAISAAIILDTHAPEGSLLINNGQPFTNQHTVSLTVNAQDLVSGLDSLRFSNDLSIWSVWQAFSPPYTWTLNGNEGVNTLYVQLRDGAGNVSLYEDGIVFDNTPPSSGVAGFTRQADGYRIYWDGSDALSGVKHYTIQRKEEVSGGWQDWQVETAANSALFNGEAGHTYYFRSHAMDNAGNWGNWSANADGELTLTPTRQIYLPYVLR